MKPLSFAFQRLRTAVERTMQTHGRNYSRAQPPLLTCKAHQTSQQAAPTGCGQFQNHAVLLRKVVSSASVC